MLVKTPRITGAQVPLFKSVFDVRLVLLTFLTFSIISSFLLGNYINDKNNRVAPQKTEAADCSGHDGAFGDNSCRWSCNIQLNGNPINIPSCCDEIEKTGDPTVCVFDARRVCTPGQCSTIPEGVARGRCAQLWEVGCCPSWTPGCGLKPLPPQIISLIPTLTAFPVPMEQLIPTLSAAPIATGIQSPSVTGSVIPSSWPLSPSPAVDPTDSPVYISPTVYGSPPVYYNPTENIISPTDFDTFPKPDSGYKPEVTQYLPPVYTGGGGNHTPPPATNHQTQNNVQTGDNHTPSMVVEISHGFTSMISDTAKNLLHFFSLVLP